MSESAILIRQLKKSFGNKKVLCGLDMDIPKGAIYAFLGRNGEGKTTTMRMILDILTPDSGSIKVLGMNAHKESEKIKGLVGYIPESPFYYDWMTAGEILDFVKSFYAGKWDDAMVEGLLKKFKLERSTKFGQMSMGMKAKVSLAAALGHNPEILLLDDPTSGLDVVIRREFLESLVEIVDVSQCTVLFSTHLLTEVERIADSIGLLRNGILEIQQDIESLKERVKRVQIRFEDQVDSAILKKFQNSVIHRKIDGRLLDVVVRDFDAEAVAEVHNWGKCRAEVLDMDLEEIFVAFTRDSDFAEVK